MSQVKVCKECKEEKSTDEFYKARNSFQARCKMCHNLNRKIKRLMLKEKKIRDRPEYKKCKDCEILKPLDHFYRAGNRYQTRCKPCHNIFCRKYKKKKIKINPIKKLDEAHQQLIKDYDYSYPFSFLAQRIGVSPNTIYHWRERGYWHKYFHELEPRG